MLNLRLSYDVCEMLQCVDKTTYMEVIYIENSLEISK